VVFFNNRMDLIQILRQIAQRQSGIRLLNIYKGLPISYDTHIVAVGNSDIRVMGNKNHITCLYYQGESFLQGEELPATVRSKVISLNLAREYAVLTDFEVAPPTIGNRSQIRVEPGEPLIVSIQFRGSAYEFLAPLADISASGASVYFESFMFPVRIAQPGSDLTMTISLPDTATRRLKNTSAKVGSEERKLLPSPRKATPGHVDVTANGRVVSVRFDPETRRYRVSIQMFFKDLSRMVILQYISQRQSEIIQDLRILSEDLYNRRNMVR